MAPSDASRPSNRFVLLQALFALPFIIGGILAGAAVWMLAEDGGRVAKDCAAFFLASLPFLAFGGVGMVRLHIRARHAGSSDQLLELLRTRTGAVNIVLGVLTFCVGVAMTWYLYVKRKEVSVESHLLYVLGAAELGYGLWQVLRGRPAKQR